MRSLTNYSKLNQKFPTKGLSTLLTTFCLMGSIALCPTISFSKNTLTSFPEKTSQDQPAQEADAATKKKAYDAYMAAKAEKEPATQIKMLKESLKLYPFYAQYYKPLLTSICTNYYGTKFQAALKSGSENIPDALGVVDSIKEDVPELHYTYLVTLSDILLKLAKTSSITNADESRAYLKQAIDLTNAGKKPLELSSDKKLVEVKDEVWAKQKPKQLGQLYLTLGLFAWKASKNPDEALILLKESKAQNCSDVFVYDTAAKIYKEKYSPLAKEYEALTDEQKQSEEGKAKLNKVFERVDQILEEEAKLLAVGEGKINEKAKEAISKEVEEFWKSRYDGKIDGLAEFLAKAKSDCANAVTASK